MLRYLSETRQHGLNYFPGKINFNGFVGSGYAGFTSWRKSRSGYILKLGSATCRFGGRKQASVALSTGEAEYFALTLAAQEALWIIRVLPGGRNKLHGSVCIHSYDQCALNWAVGEKYPSGHPKHIDVKILFVRNLVKRNVDETKYIPRELTDVDLLTNPIEPNNIKAILNRIGLGQNIKEEC